MLSILQDLTLFIPDTGQSGIINNDQRQELQAHLLSLKQQHQVQQQMLLAQYHDQQMRLQLEQEKQMHEQVKVNVRIKRKCIVNSKMKGVPLYK